MAGTKAGGIKAAATNKLRHGDGFYARIGAKGGRNGNTGGFASNPALAKVAGAKGGRISSRAGVKNGEGQAKWKRPWRNTKQVVEDGKLVTKINVKYIPSK